MNWFLGADISTAYFKRICLCSRCEHRVFTFYEFCFTSLCNCFEFILWPILSLPTVLFCLPRLFFRRHYPINSVTFSSLDPKDQRWVVIIRTIEMISYGWLWPALFCLNLLIHNNHLALSAAKLVDIKLEVGNIQILSQYWDLISDNGK